MCLKYLLNFSSKADSARVFFLCCIFVSGLYNYFDVINVAWCGASSAKLPIFGLFSRPGHRKLALSLQKKILS